MSVVAATAPAATPAAPAAVVPAADSQPASKIEPHLQPQKRAKIAPSSSDAASPAAPDTGSSAPQAQVTTPATATPPDGDAATPGLTAAELEKRFQSLVGKSKQLRDREATLKATEAELTELRGIRDRLKKRDYSLIEEHGGSIDDWSTRWLEKQGQPTNPVSKELREAREKIAALEKWQSEQATEKQTAEQKKVQAEAESAVNAFKGEIAEHLSKSDKYRMLTTAKIEHEVFNVIQQHAARTQAEFGTPQILSTDEAAAYVQRYYAPKLKETVKGLLALPEFQDVLTELTKAATPNAGNQPGGERPKPTQPETPGPAARQATTLTPELAGSSPPRGEQKLSRKERMAAAKAVLRFTS